jgi:hypothetical protein
MPYEGPELGNKVFYTCFLGSELIGDPSMVNSIIELDACGSTAADASLPPDSSRLTASGSIILGTVTELNDGEWWGLNLENVPRDESVLT